MNAVTTPSNRSSDAIGYASAQKVPQNPSSWYVLEGMMTRYQIASPPPTMTVPASSMNFQYSFSTRRASGIDSSPASPNP